MTKRNERNNIDSELCPDCLSDKFHFRESIENTDADGNRGLRVMWRVCDGCGNEM